MIICGSGFRGEGLGFRDRGENVRHFSAVHWKDCRNKRNVIVTFSKSQGPHFGVGLTKIFDLFLFAE